MRTRIGFVSNSSSSSFLIPINALEAYQIEMIKDHINVARNWQQYHTDKDMYVRDDDRWDIEVKEKCLFGYTFMDNFDMGFFLTEIIGMTNHIYWESEHGLDLDEINREILIEKRKDKLDNLENVDPDL